MDSFFLLPLQNTNTHVCDFEIPLKGLVTQTLLFVTPRPPEKTARDLGFKQISYGFFTFADFADMRFWINRACLLIDRTNQLVIHLFLSQT